MCALIRHQRKILLEAALSLHTLKSLPVTVSLAGAAIQVRSRRAEQLWEGWGGAGWLSHLVLYECGLAAGLCSSPQSCPRSAPPSLLVLRCGAPDTPHGPCRWAPQLLGPAPPLAPPELIKAAFLWLLPEICPPASNHHSSLNSLGLFKG